MSGRSFQRLAIAALVSVMLLIFVGAIVRVSGAGLGCPDWPTCWGCLIPPWNKEQVDLSRIDFDRFRAKAERLGRDPESVTPERILDSFNPVHTWTEFINRLCSLPVGLFTLATFIAATIRFRGRGAVFWAAFGSLLLVLFNAWLGARVVYSGLQPGVITLHMAAAMLLVALLVFTAWAGAGEHRWRIPLDGPLAGWARLAIGMLLALTVAEGVLGSQVRELTDQMKLDRGGAPRSEWIGELEQAGVYLVHRSFSWVILVAAVAHFALARGARPAGAGPLERVILGVVLAQMVLGVFMSQVVIHPVVQVLHVGLSSVLLCAEVLWFLASRGRGG
jgi:cytochrome c oxidase assembly protein subunit 15